jgi:tetratricopeptide (TPR) repeat protein
MRALKLTILLSLLPLALVAAKQPERKDIRLGNKEYKKQSYGEAELSYRRAMEKAPASANAKYNLGNALYKQVDTTMQPEEAKQQMEQVHKLYENAAETYTDDNQKAAAHYNEGNAYLREQNWQAAIDSYKKSLRLNPDDMEAKQNLVFAQAMNNQQQQNPQQNQDKEKEKKDEKEKEKEKEKNQDQQQNKQEQDKEKNDQQQQQQQQQEQKISKEDAQRMLQALEQQEKDTQEKVKREKAQKAQQRSPGKDW